MSAIEIIDKKIQEAQTGIDSCVSYICQFSELKRQGVCGMGDAMKEQAEMMTIYQARRDILKDLRDEIEGVTK